MNDQLTSMGFYTPFHNYPPSSHHYSQSHSTPLPRITAHHDPHSRGTDSASPDSQWSSPSLLTPVDPIEPYVSRYPGQQHCREC